MEEGMRDWKIPAPKVETGEDFCRTMLYWHKSLSDWTKEEKIRTCYIYVCYCYVNGIDATNTALRERFGVTDKNKAVISRIVKETVEKGYIRLYDETTAPRYYRYIPYWS